MCADSAWRRRTRWCRSSAMRVCSVKCLKSYAAACQWWCTRPIRCRSRSANSAQPGWTMPTNSGNVVWTSLRRCTIYYRSLRRNRCWYFWTRWRTRKIHARFVDYIFESLQRRCSWYLEESFIIILKINFKCCSSICNWLLLINLYLVMYLSNIYFILKIMGTDM